MTKEKNYAWVLCPLILLFFTLFNSCSEDSSGVIVEEDPWKQLADFPEASRRSGIAFSIENKLYIGVGRCDDDYVYKDFWSYDPLQNKWEQIADPDVRSYGSLAFTLNGKGYFLPMFNTLGDGVSNGLQASPQFFEYDNLADKWTEKKPYPGVHGGGAVSFVIDNIGYIFLGYNFSYTTTEKATLFAYNPIADEWTEKAELPGGPARSDAAGFSIGGKAYIIGGVSYLGSFFNEVWEYDPAKNTWEQKNDFPGKGRNGFFGFSIGDKGYVGGGSSNYAPNGDYATHEFWQYDPSIDEWQQLDNHPGLGCWKPYSATVGEFAYVLGGLTDKACFNDFWRFHP